MLRVGLVLSPSLSQAWVATLVRRVQESSFAEVAAVVHVAPEGSAPGGMFSRQRWSRLLFRWYERWDRRRNLSAKSACSPADPSALLTGVPVVSLRSGNDRADVRKALESLDLDLLLCLDTAHGTGLPQGVTRYGLWVLDVAGTHEHPEQPPAWREHAGRQAHVTTRLLGFAEVAAAGNAPRLLYESRAALNPFSLAQSRSPIYWKAAEIVLRCLQSLAAGGQSYLDGLPAAMPELPPEAGRPASPERSGRLGMSRFLRGELVRRIQARRKASRRATFAKWCIGIRSRTAGVGFDSPENYRLIVAPGDRFYADPFFFAHAGRTWLFFEDFRYPEGKAVISCCELNARGEPGAAFEVLRLPYHLSYPFLFQEGDTIYMLPESRGHRSVSLFRATAFPHRWEHDTDLFSGVDIVDATLHHAEDGTWWMFAGVSNGNYSNSDELCLFFAEAIRGPWTPHPQNPVISDVRRARPAGRVFRDGGRLIRPAQDCGPAYGYGLVFAEIEVLTRTVYRERVLGRLLPESVPGNTANHTYNRSGDLETIDRFFIESRLPETETFDGKDLSPVPTA